ncbi:hypothetical protein H0R94_10730 [Treponema socranskii]|uniref:hypothetical protein n=1 Tax=Treponema socranskii TaxID=53419 RepID=UPI003D8BF460
MKRIFSVLIIFSALACAVFFTGCQDVIFAKIMGEVELEDATITGRVNTIVRCKLGTQEYLFIQNGRVYGKPASSASHGDWNLMSDGLPKLSYDYYNKKFNGIYIYQLASTPTTLYALGAEIYENTEEGENTAGSRYLYYFDTGSKTWLKTYDNDVTGTSGNTTIFCTNTRDATNRKAYIRMNKNVYALNDSPVSNATCIATTAETSALGDAPGESTVSAVYAGSVYFFNSCSATNETSVPATHVYWASGSTLKHVSAGTSSSSGASAVSCSTNIKSIAATSDAIILGTKGRGLEKTTNTSGVPGSSLTGFSTNADSALGSPYIIPALLCVDSAASETGAMLYASADFKRKSSSSGGNYKDIGLWSYYPSRGNWNRE